MYCLKPEDWSCDIACANYKALAHQNSCSHQSEAQVNTERSYISHMSNEKKKTLTSNYFASGSVEQGGGHVPLPNIFKILKS